MDEIYTAEEISTCIQSLAGKLYDHLSARENLICIAILEGAVQFAEDLLDALRAKGLHAEFATLGLSSYGSGRSSGEISVTSEIALSVSGATILLLDDIADTGQTITYAKEYLTNLGAREIVTAVLLDKGKLPDQMRASLEPLYGGLLCPDRFVVGYGMDLDGKYRDLQVIAAFD